jgi:hypothetical protein
MTPEERAKRLRELRATAPHWRPAKPTGHQRTDDGAERHASDDAELDAKLAEITGRILASVDRNRTRAERYRQATTTDEQRPITPYREDT